MRTMTTSFSRTCAGCGALNRVLILSTGLTPSWRICCSRCGAIVVDPRGSRQDGPPAPARSAEIVHLPVPVGQNRSPAVRRARQEAAGGTALSLRFWSPRARSGASTGVSFLAACGLVLAVLVIDQDAAIEGAPVSGLASTGATAQSGHEFTVGSLDSATADAVADPTVPRQARYAPPIIPRYRIAAEMALGSRPSAYPDPLEGMIDLQLAALSDPEKAAETEAGLDLSPAARREIQRRLRLASFDPRGVDGKFGPATRAAISAWQEQNRLPATGYMSERAITLLADQTDAAYRSWRVADQARRARERQFAAKQPVPRPQHASDVGCVREWSGAITYGHNLRCDLKGLRESLAGLFELRGRSDSSRVFGKRPDDA